MKVAVCLSGQYRTFDAQCVQNTLKHYLLNKYDCDVYFSTWDNRGASMNHGNPLLYKDASEIITESSIHKYISNCTIEIENYNNWYNNISNNYKRIIDTTGIVSNSIPQLYKKYKSYTLIPPYKKYDFVIITRPDLFFFGEFDLEHLTDKNTIWNFNPKNSWAFHLSRIYDILYMGHQDDIEKMSKCYFSVEKLNEDPFGSNLLSTDCCKMLYLYARKFHNLSVKSTPTIIGNVYRDESSIDYNLNNCKIPIKGFKEKFLL